MFTNGGFSEILLVDVLMNENSNWEIPFLNSNTEWKHVCPRCCLNCIYFLLLAFQSDTAIRMSILHLLRGLEILVQFLNYWIVIVFAVVLSNAMSQNSNYPGRRTHLLSRKERMADGMSIRDYAVRFELSISNRFIQLNFYHIYSAFAIEQLKHYVIKRPKTFLTSLKYLIKRS